MVRRETYGDICHRIDMKQWRLAGLPYGWDWGSDYYMFYEKDL
jgi:hypothetical protein